MTDLDAAALDLTMRDPTAVQPRLVPIIKGVRLHRPSELVQEIL